MDNLIQALIDFYADEENQKAFEEWQQKRLQEAKEAAS